MGCKIGGKATLAASVVELFLTAGFPSFLPPTRWKLLLVLAN